MYRFCNYLCGAQVPYHYFRAISKMAFAVVWILLTYTLIKGTVIAGAKCQQVDTSAFYWYIVSNINIGVCSAIYICCSLFVKIQRNTNYFKASLWELWLPVFFTLILILPANFSTTALIFAMVLMLVFIGKYPLKYIGIIIGEEFCFLLFL
jgi:cell division protein FtsW